MRCAGVRAYSLGEAVSRRCRQTHSHWHVLLPGAWSTSASSRTTSTRVGRVEGGLLSLSLLLTPRSRVRTPSLALRLTGRVGSCNPPNLLAWLNQEATTANLVFPLSSYSKGSYYSKGSCAPNQPRHLTHRLVSFQSFFPLSPSSRCLGPSGEHSSPAHLEPH